MLTMGADKVFPEEALRPQWCQRLFGKGSCSLQGPSCHLKEGHKGEKTEQKICTSSFLLST